MKSTLIKWDSSDSFLPLRTLHDSGIKFAISGRWQVLATQGHGTDCPVWAAASLASWGGCADQMVGDTARRMRSRAIASSDSLDQWCYTSKEDEPERNRQGVG
jgi:hypothetical protein